MWELSEGMATVPTADGMTVDGSAPQVFEFGPRAVIFHIPNDV